MDPAYNGAQVLKRPLGRRAGLAQPGLVLSLLLVPPNSAPDGRRGLLGARRVREYGGRLARLLRLVLARLRRLGLGLRTPPPVPQLHPEPAYAAARAGDLGATELGTGRLDRLDRRGRDRQHTLAPERFRLRLVLGIRPNAAKVEGSSTVARAAYPSAEGWNWSGPKSRAGAAAKSGPRIEPSDTLRPPASTTVMVCAAASRRDHDRATCLSGGAIGLMVPRSGHVPTSTAIPASRRRRTASPRCRTDWLGSTVWVTSLAPMRITATSGSIGSVPSTCWRRSEDWAPTTANSRR